MLLTFKQAALTRVLIIEKANCYVYITSDGGHRLRTKRIRHDPYSKCVLVPFKPEHNQTIFLGTTMLTHLCFRNKILPGLSEVASFLRSDFLALKDRLEEEGMDLQIVDLSILEDDWR